MLNISNIKEREKMWLEKGEQFNRSDMCNCPYCNAVTITWGDIFIPPLFVQLRNPDWEMFSYHSKRYFCTECQNFWDVLDKKENE